MLREINTNELEAVAGGCPIDLRGSGATAEQAAELCAELTRNNGPVGYTPRSAGGQVGTRVGSGTRIGNHGNSSIA